MHILSERDNVVTLHIYDDSR